MGASDVFPSVGLEVGHLNPASDHGRRLQQFEQLKATPLDLDPARGQPKTKGRRKTTAQHKDKDTGAARKTAAAAKQLRSDFGVWPGLQPDPIMAIRRLVGASSMDSGALFWTADGARIGMLPCSLFYISESHQPCSPPCPLH